MWFRKRKCKWNTYRKIKLELEIIKEKIIRKSPNINIKQHKVHKFILIFQELLNQIKLDNIQDYNSKEETHTEDGIWDILTSIGQELYKFFQHDINSLELPEIV